MWTPGKTISHMEEEAIKGAMAFFGNNKTKVAAALNICVNTLNTKLKDYETVQEKAQSLDGRLLGTPSPFYVEPPAEPPTKLSMPVQERKEVQKVPSNRSKTRNA